MKDKIEIEIENNNLETAKKAITDLEKSAIIEKSEYLRTKLLEKINRYKNLYSAKISIKTNNLEQKECFSFSSNDLFAVHDYLEYFDFTNQSFLFEKIYNKGEINNCKACIFEDLEILESLVIDNCNNCTIKCKTKQLRIRNSINIKIELFTEAGVSLENSSQITVRELLSIKGKQITENEKKMNNFYKINDFSCPFKTQNYNIL